MSTYAYQHTLHRQQLPALLARPNLTVHTLGGRLRSRTTTEVGEWALRALRDINVDVAFLGTNEISAEWGLTTPDPDEAAVKRAMLGCAQRRVLLADHTKVGLVSAARHADLTDIDLMITDAGISDDQLHSLRRAGLHVEQA